MSLQNSLILILLLSLSVPSKTPAASAESKDIKTFSLVGYKKVFNHSKSIEIHQYGRVPLAWPLSWSSLYPRNSGVSLSLLLVSVWDSYCLGVFTKSMGMLKQ